MSILIGITGKARSGKDTVGEHFIKVFEVERYGFADPLKRACSEMFGVPLDHFYNDDLKEVNIPFWNYSPRQMAQLLGTEGGRELFDENIWVKRAQIEYNRMILEHGPGMVVTDVRFENEATWVRDNGGVVIHVERPGADGVVGESNHASEMGIDISKNDIIITNDGTLDQLYENAEIAIASHLASKELAAAGCR